MSVNVELDRKNLLDLWNKSFVIVKQFEELGIKSPEYYYHNGVVDTCRFFFGEKEAYGRETDN